MRGGGPIQPAVRLPFSGVFPIRQEQRCHSGHAPRRSASVVASIRRVKGYVLSYALSFTPDGASARIAAELPAYAVEVLASFASPPTDTVGMIRERRSDMY